MSTQHGNGENNILQGTTDADTLIGHGGDDTYIVNHAGDVVQELVRVSSNLANSPGEITRISISQAGSQVNGNSYNASFSPDGSKLLFHSYASNLITGDTNTRSDVFIKDLLTGQVTRVSTNTAGAQVNGSSLNASFSPDGTKVLFYSEATNLVTNDTNNRADIFIKDLMTGAVTRVNTTTLGEQANNYSDNARFTADGTSVVFDSNEGLSPDDTDGNPDIFIKNLMTGDITLASTTRDGDNIRLHSSKGIISPDGSKLSFEVVYDYTFVSSSGAHYAKHYDYIMIKDLNTGEIVDTLGGQLLLPGSSILQYTGKASFSADNTKVIFYSNVDLLNSSTLVHEDCIFIKDLIGGGIEKIGAGNDPQFFDNDTKVIYRNGTDVYVKDLVGGTISCISRDENGNPVTGASAANFKVSPFSDQVLFESDSNGWVTGDTNNVSDIFIKDISSLYTMQDGGGADTVESSVSYTLPEFVENLILTGTANINGTGNALDNSITGNSGNNNIDGKQGADSALGGAGNDIYYIDEDGDRVIEYHETVEWRDAGYIYNEQDDGGYDKIFSSIDFGLVDKFYDYQHVDSGETRTLTSGLYVEEIELTGSGDLKAFGNYQDNKLIGNTGNNILDGGSGNDVLDGRAGADILRGGSGNDTYIVDQLDVIEEFELPGNTATKINNAEGVGLNGNSADPFLSTDGKKLVFSSFADNLVAGDTNATSDLFVKDLTSGQISRVSLSANAGEANGSSFGGKFTSDATRVVFDSAASNLLAADSNKVRDVFIKDLISGGVVQVSTASNGAQANGASYAADVNANGSKVVFESDATNLVAGDTNSKTDIFVKDFSTGQTMQVSTGMNGEQANDASVEADISADGTKIIFTSWASNLVQNDTNNARDIFVKDLLTGKITRVSTGTDGQQGDADSRDAMISADGRKVVFMSDATNLVDNDTNGVSDIFVKDLVTGQITRVSTTAAGSQLDMESYYASISADGKKVSFMSFAKHLGNEYNSDENGIYIKDLETGSLFLASGASYLQGYNSYSALSENGAQIAFSRNTGFATGDTKWNIFVNNQLQPQDQGGVDTVQTAVSYALGKGLENIQLIGGSHINATGNSMSNSLLGNSGNNVLDGKAGADSMAGGLGNDTYYLDNQNDQVIEKFGEGSDKVFSSVSYGLGAAHVEVLQLTGSAHINATGNSASNSLLGNSGNNILNGKGGADSMSGGLGNDTYYVDNVADLVVEKFGEGKDTLFSSVSYGLGAAHVEVLQLTGSDHINATGNSASNSLLGNSGNNILNGKGGSDSMSGGLGNDTYYVDNVADLVVEKFGEGKDTLFSSVSYGLGAAHVEVLQLTGSDHINATGNSASNSLLGNSGNNVLNGKGGSDSMSGGLGNDTYYVDNQNDQVIEKFGEGRDTLFSIVSYGLGAAHIEVLQLTGGAHINATGNSASNSLLGNSGNNVLNGKGGSDSMSGGLGNDTYYVDNVADLVVEKFGEGKDTLFSSVSYGLGAAHVEVLQLTGSAHINATGNSASNSLLGNSGSNILNGKGGTDIFTGGNGQDTAIYDLLNAKDSRGGNGSDSWTDFLVGKVTSNVNADKIDISDLLTSYSGNGSALSLKAYVKLLHDGDDTVLQIDRDGSGGSYGFSTLLTLNNVNVDLATLLSNQQLLV